MDYINNALNYLETTLNSIKSAINTTKDILTTIGSIIGTVVDILGFIGFKVFILLITTAFILWLLNLVSPITRKTNYIISVCLVVWLAITSKMPLQLVILKYVFIIILPFIITYVANFLINNLSGIIKVFFNKFRILFSKININIFKKHNYLLKNNDKISLLFSSDLPSLDEIEKVKEIIKSFGYKISILESEKISMADDNGKIIFSNQLKLNQLLKSIQSKDIDLMWFWSNSYGINEILFELNKIRPLKQNKMIIGSGDNSFILNFLQEKWDWKIIYGYNLKSFLNNNYKKDDIKLSEIIFKNNSYNMSLINDYNLDNNYFIKEKIIGGELSAVIESIGTYSQIKFKNKILFLDYNFNDKMMFYRFLTHLQNYIFTNNVFPKAIVFANIYNSNISGVSKIILNFSNNLKNNNINIPFFFISKISFIKLNTNSIIEYKNNKINLYIDCKN